jgi:prepilin-type N-terminal cleavage/methylation domain-containing protein
MSYFRKLLEPTNPRTLESFSKGFTMIEIIIVIVILSIVSAISIKFLVDSLRIYTMTVNQKTLLDEGKLALERMCRDIRDAKSITSTSTSITLTRTNATAQDNANESLTFELNGTTLRKVKASTPYAMASYVTAFTVTNTNNEVKLQLTLSMGTGEKVTLQTKVYPKNLGDSTTYKNFFNNWQEELSS